MAVMALPDCLKWLETPQPRPGYIKKYISGNIVLATIVVLISNFTQPLVKLWLQWQRRGANWPRFGHMLSMQQKSTSLRVGKGGNRCYGRSSELLCCQNQRTPW